MWKRATSVPEAQVTGRWSVFEKTFVVDNLSLMTTVEIATALGRSYFSVQGYLQSSGLIGQRKTVKRLNGRALYGLLETDLAYLAGIVDGEGTVTVARKFNSHAGKTYYQPVINICNTSEALAQWVRTRGFKTSTSISSRRVPYWKMSVGGYWVGDVLGLLKPWLVVKQPQATFVQEFCTLRLSQRHRDSPTARMLQIYKELRRLNLRVSPPREFRSPASSTTS